MAEKTEFAARLRQAVKEGMLLVAYSEANIIETLRRPKQSSREIELRIIREFTFGLFIDADMRLHKRDPESVATELLSRQDMAGTLDKYFNELMTSVYLSKPAPVSAEPIAGGSKHLNMLSPSEVLERVQASLDELHGFNGLELSIEDYQKTVNFIMNTMLEKLPQIFPILNHPDIKHKLTSALETERLSLKEASPPKIDFRELKKTLKQLHVPSKHFPGLITAAVQAFGFWPGDKKGEKRRPGYIDRDDLEHANYGACCDIFVIGEKAFPHRMAVAKAELGLQTDILLFQEFSDLLEKYYPPIIQDL